MSEDKNQENLFAETLKWISDKLSKNNIPYMITGQFNQHPRSAMAFLDKKGKNYVEFYDDAMDEH